MCAQHRSDTIADIKQALVARQGTGRQGKPGADPGDQYATCRPVSISISLSSIAPWLGWIHRPGRRPLQPRGPAGQRQVHVFVPPKSAPPGLLRMAEQATRILWKPCRPRPIRWASSASRTFSAGFTATPISTQKDVCNLLRVGQIGDVNFRTAAERFRLIGEAEGATVFVRYKRDENDKAIDELLGKLKKEGPQRWLRKLQRYGVTSTSATCNALEGLGDIVPLGGDFSGLYAQSFGNDALYDRVLGISVDGAPGDPASLTI